MNISATDFVILVLGSGSCGEAPRAASLCATEEAKRLYGKHKIHLGPGPARLGLESRAQPGLEPGP